MIRGVIMVVAFGASGPAVAGVPLIPIPLPGLRVPPAPALASSRVRPVVAEARTTKRPKAASTVDSHEMFELNAKAAPQQRAAPPADIAGALLTMSRPQQSERWVVEPGDTDTTSQAGAYYAVSDTMKPRRYRHRGSTMVTLRIDGAEESEPVSMDGVPGVVWQMVPK